MPPEKLIRCGIGDVTEPLPEAIRKAMHDAVDEQGNRETFRGYGPEQGYDFLREAIAENQYGEVGIDPDEIFISDGSKCDTGNILDIFGPGNRIAITDPVYPVYVDTNVMAGNTGEADESGAFEGLVYLPCTSENDFVPAIPDEKVDLIYLCYPNNPTGATATRTQLEEWVAYARENKAIILYDAAYEAFIQEDDVPRSIFEIEGAKELCDRVPQLFQERRIHRGALRLHHHPEAAHGAGRRTATRSRSIPSGRAVTAPSSTGPAIPCNAEPPPSFPNKGNRRSPLSSSTTWATPSCSGKPAKKSDCTVFGGVNAPYVWVGCPEGVDSWGMFDRMLEEAAVVITPGAGFGAAGEGILSDLRLQQPGKRRGSLPAYCGKFGIENLGLNRLPYTAPDAMRQANVAATSRTRLRKDLFHLPVAVFIRCIGGR